MHPQTFCVRLQQPQRLINSDLGGIVNKQGFKVEEKVLQFLSKTSFDIYMFKKKN